MTRPLILLLGLLLTTPAAAQSKWDKVEIKTTKVSDGVWMLQGKGGNVALCAGPDGAFLVDDQFAPLTKKIQAAVAKVTDQPIRFVVNTHWHRDHTGGNENLGKAGAVIVAHDNVRTRLSSDQLVKALNAKVLAKPPIARPVITFAESVTFHLNGDTIRVIHVAPAHTDGDSLVLFKRANVLHTGDTYFNGFYPFIDESSGGTLSGMIAAADRSLSLINARTKIIPGHGPVSNAAELRVYRHMLVTVRSRIRGLLDEGLSIDDVVAAKPTRDFDAKWGKGFLKPDRWTRIVTSILLKEYKRRRAKKRPRKVQ